MSSSASNPIHSFIQRNPQIQGVKLTVVESCFDKHLDEAKTETATFTIESFPAALRPMLLFEESFHRLNTDSAPIRFAERALHEGGRYEKCTALKGAPDYLSYTRKVTCELTVVD